MVLAIACAKLALAITPAEIPPSLRSRLPGVLLKMADPRALAAISLADLEEFAEAYEQGRLKFVSETKVMEHSGPLTPELAELVLQTPAGAPYIKERFTRMAMQAYGRGVFSKLKWLVRDNDDGSVTIEIWYASNDAQVLVPLYDSNGISGIRAGLSYRDFRVGGKDRQGEIWGEASQHETDEPEGGVSYADNTLNNGRNSLSTTFSVTNQWRHRGETTPADANLRQRTAELDTAYAWQHSARLGLDSTSYGIGLGAYGQDSYIYSGDPTAGGTAPRSDFNQVANAGYVRLFWHDASRNLAFTPSSGWDYSLAVEKNFGGFDYTQASANLRYYIAERNVLGIKPAGVESSSLPNDVGRLFPTASIALQAQAVVADGDVPYSREALADVPGVLRGLSYDRHYGSKLLGLRGEYRFALDANRRNEAFVFTDHAMYGERLDKLEGADTFGVGAVLRLPVYGGFKLGGWYGWSFDGDDSSYGIAMGYMF
jgi:hypothetical protein